MWEILKHKSVKNKGELKKKDQTTDFVKLNVFNLLKKSSWVIWITKQKSE